LGSVYVVGEGVRRYQPDGMFDRTVFPLIANNLMFDRDGGAWGTDGSEDAVVRYDSQMNLLGKLIDAGHGGLSSNFRPEGIALIYAIPEPSTATLSTLVCLLGALRRRVPSC
jgi:hypothetical protein